MMITVVTEVRLTLWDGHSHGWNTWIADGITFKCIDGITFCCKISAWKFYHCRVKTFTGKLVFQMQMSFGRAKHGNEIKCEALSTHKIRIATETGLFHMTLTVIV